MDTLPVIHALHIISQVVCLCLETLTNSTAQLATASLAKACLLHALSLYNMIYCGNLGFTLVDAGGIIPHQSANRAILPG